VGQEGTITVVAEDGTPIEGYEPFTPRRTATGQGPPPVESTVDKSAAEKK
jgi:hypothetical protein